MRPRSIAELYQTAARVWLTAAALSLLLPESARAGIWLPLHLTLAGAATVAICGAMQTFVLAMTATPAPPTGVTALQFLLVNGGALAIAVGFPGDQPWLVAAGGAAFTIAMLVLGAIVWRAWARALNKRHGLPIAMYGAAIACVVVGGVLGALVGARVVSGLTWIELRGAHLSLNVLGWVSITIAATLITLLPTVLRVRMPGWRGTATGVLLVSGAAMVASGLGLQNDELLAWGGVAYVAGVAGVAWMVVRVLATPRKWPAPVSAKHLLAALCWFVGGSVGFGMQCVRGPIAVVQFQPVFLVAFVGGWIVQTLLGAWLFLLPMWRAGHPEQRRRSWAAVEYLGGLQLLALNAGLVIMALRGGTPDPGAAGAVGVGLALGGAGLALAKAWAFPLLARGPVITPRARAMWWADQEPGRAAPDPGE